jgi:SHAQKYF class myb-like DNA-binding protein
MNKGKWTQDEHETFLLEWAKYGNNWKIIAKIVKTRTAVQIKSHAQNHVQKSFPPEKKA